MENNPVPVNQKTCNFQFLHMFFSLSLYDFPRVNCWFRLQFFRTCFPLRYNSCFIYSYFCLHSNQFFCWFDNDMLQLNCFFGVFFAPYWSIFGSLWRAQFVQCKDLSKYETFGGHLPSDAVAIKINSSNNN